MQFERELETEVPGIVAQGAHVRRDGVGNVAPVPRRRFHPRLHRHPVGAQSLRQRQSGLNERHLAVTRRRVAKQTVTRVDGGDGQSEAAQRVLQGGNLGLGSQRGVEVRAIAWVHSDVDQIETLAGDLPRATSSGSKR